MDNTKLFGKLAEHENEMKWLANSRVKLKKKDKVKEDKKRPFFEIFGEEIKGRKIWFYEEYPKEEEMRLLVRCYNRCLERNKFKHFDKGLINFKKTHPPKREHKKKDDDVTFYECRKSGYYRATCPSLTKHHKKKDKKF